MEDLTVSLVQADLHWEQSEANLSQFEERIWDISETDLIILPEMFSSGFSMDAKKLAEPVNGRALKWMQHMAIQKTAAITGSYIVKDKGHYYNRLYFVFPDGAAAYYDKRHLFTLAGEDKQYTAGSQRLIVNYREWRICPMICYDLRFPVWSRSQKKNDRHYEYDMLLYVANWPDARINAWDTLLKARAIENIAYCAGVNRVGIDGHSKSYPGHSALYSHKGETLIFSHLSETITVKLSASSLNTFRSKYPFQLDADHYTITHL